MVKYGARVCNAFLQAHEASMSKPLSRQKFALWPERLRLFFVGPVAEWGSGGLFEGNPWGLMGFLQSALAAAAAAFLFPRPDAWRCGIVQASIRGRSKLRLMINDSGAHASFTGTSCSFLNSSGLTGEVSWHFLSVTTGSVAARPLALDLIRAVASSGRSRGTLRRF